jgi:hypothetical protein
LGVEGGFPGIFLLSFLGVWEPGTGSSDMPISSDARLGTIAVNPNLPSKRGGGAVHQVVGALRTACK